jgi:hypothetical protein
MISIKAIILKHSILSLNLINNFSRIIFFRYAVFTTCHLLFSLIISFIKFFFYHFFKIDITFVSDRRLLFYIRNLIVLEKLLVIFQNSVIIASVMFTQTFCFVSSWWCRRSLFLTRNWNKLLSLIVMSGIWINYYGIFIRVY